MIKNKIFKVSRDRSDSLYSKETRSKILAVAGTKDSGKR